MLQWIWSTYLNYCFCFLWIKTRSGIGMSYLNSAFNFLRNLHTIFHSVFSRLRSQPKVHKGSLFSTSSTRVFFLIIAILTDVWWYIIVILTCIFLMIGDVEHIFMCLYVFFGKMSIHIFPFFIWIVCFFAVVLYVFWILAPYQIYDLQLFSPFFRLIFLFCEWFPLLYIIFPLSQVEYKILLCVFAFLLLIVSLSISYS